ncbi:MAG: dapB [Bacteriovoracaceae bacterium]|nr:dapB [Bacteriovoracaceae bacterium]
MKAIVLVGSTGKMSRILQELCQEQKLPFKVFSEKASPALQIKNFSGTKGVIDFSLPDATEKICRMAIEANVPYICGTTGWKSKSEIDNLFTEASKKIAVVKDANFSLGVEILSEASEILAKALSSELLITDIHHSQKKDAPSGTALKIEARMKKANPKSLVKINSIREGEVFGEHRILATFEDQTLEFIHRAHSRKPFASGALKALEWASKQKPGLYSMKDVLPVKEIRS